MCDESDDLGPTEDMSALYDRLANQIEREEKLINNRFSWMLTAEGFMFAAIALLGKMSQQNHLYAAIVDIIPIVGGLIAFAALIGVWGAYLSKREYKRIYNIELANSPDIYPRPFGGNGAHLAGLVPSVILPIFIILAWLKIWIALQC